MQLKYFIIYFLIAMTATMMVTKCLISYFRKKQFGQYIREEGPQGHLKKEGTPTMGGLAIVTGVIIGAISTIRPDPHTAVTIATMLAFGALGFLDDYSKIAKGQNLGLNAKQKLVLQFIFSLGLALYMVYAVPNGTKVFVPFSGKGVDFGIFYIPFVIFVGIAISNSVNLTDGLDGLASGVTTIVSLCIAIVGVKISSVYMMQTGIITAGALVGFLFFNKYPAKIFMGDTGSMALGGIIAAVLIVTGMPLLLPIIGLVYVIEALSVIIQVSYFKKTGGKRYFRMAPIHHHFELGGMPEYKVVAAFCAFTLACCVLGYFSVVGF